MTTETASPVNIDTLKQKLSLAMTMMRISDCRKAIAKAMSIGDRATAMGHYFQMLGFQRSLTKSAIERYEFSDSVRTVRQAADHMGYQRLPTGFRDPEFARRRRKMLKEINELQQDLTQELEAAKGDELLYRRAWDLQDQLTQRCRRLGLVQEEKEGSNKWIDPHQR